MPKFLTATLAVGVLSTVVIVLFLIACDLRAVPEPKDITWDAFWALAVSNGGDMNTYTRYTKDQCEEAKQRVREQHFGAVCVPVPIKDSTKGGS